MFSSSSNIFVSLQEVIFIFQNFFAFLQTFLHCFKYHYFPLKSFSVCVCVFFFFSFFSSLLSFSKKKRQDKLLPARKSVHLKHGIYRTGETVAKLPSHPVLKEGEILDQIVKGYFEKGYTYLEVLEYLKTYHGKTMSFQFKRYVKRTIFDNLCLEEEQPIMKLKMLPLKNYMEVGKISDIDEHGHTWRHQVSL